MAVTYLNSSTLSNAITSEDNEFAVASTANITVGDLLLWAGEIMQVRDIPVSGRVVVRRGYEGTVSFAHVSGEAFYIGTGTELQALRSQALGIMGPGQLPNVCIPGALGYDARGYEYMLVDLTATVIPGATVLISKDGLFSASILTSSGVGMVGVVVENGTSDQWVWVLRRGAYAHAKLVGGSSLATSTGSLSGASSVSTPSVGLLAITSSQATSATFSTIMGMFLSSACSTASTSATSETGYYASVWLERPYLQPRLSFVTS